MKINSFNYECAEGIAGVTITLIGPVEDFDGISLITGEVELSIRPVSTIRDDYDNKKEAASDVIQQTDNVAVEEAPAAAPKRRRRSKPADDAGDDGAGAADAVVAVADEPDPAPAGAATGRRGRRARATAAPEQTPEPAADDPAPADGRRGRRSAGGSDGGDELTDLDLGKKASEGAQKLTPKPIMAILKSFGVTSPSNLKGADRRAFVETIDAAMGGA